jgi:hypothetical protein
MSGRLGESQLLTLISAGLHKRGNELAHVLRPLRFIKRKDRFLPYASDCGSLLHHAAYLRNEEALDLLVNHYGLNPNLATVKGNTVAMVALSVDPHALLRARLPKHHLKRKHGLDVRL